MYHTELIDLYCHGTSYAQQMVMTAMQTLLLDVYIREDRVYTCIAGGRKVLRTEQLLYPILTGQIDFYRG